MGFCITYIGLLEAFWIVSEMLPISVYIETFFSGVYIEIRSSIRNLYGISFWHNSITIRYYYQKSHDLEA